MNIKNWRVKLIIKIILDELKNAEEEFPWWPADPVHAASIASEEAGELTKAVNDFYWGREKNKLGIEKEAVHAAAMYIRFLINLTAYHPEPKF